MKKLLLGLLAALSFAGPANAITTLIDFEGLEGTYTSPLTINGFVFGIARGAMPKFRIGDSSSGGFVSNGSSSLFVDSPVTIFIEREDGGDFYLHSVDYALRDSKSFLWAKYFLDDHANPISSTGTGANVSMETITPGIGQRIDRIEVLAISGGSRQFQLDNFVFGELPAVSAVPEPAAWAMMIIGFSLTGAALRRKRRLTLSHGAA